MPREAVIPTAVEHKYIRDLLYVPILDKTIARSILNKLPKPSMTRPTYDEFAAIIKCQICHSISHPGLLMRACENGNFKTYTKSMDDYDLFYENISPNTQLLLDIYVSQ